MMFILACKSCGALNQTCCDYAAEQFLVATSLAELCRRQMQIIDAQRVMLSALNKEEKRS